MIFQGFHGTIGGIKCAFLLQQEGRFGDPEGVDAGFCKLPNPMISFECCGLAFEVL